MSERGAGWLVVELCARELPARALPARLAVCAACLLQQPPSCTHWPRAAQQCRHQSQHLQAECGGWRVWKVFLLCSHANATKSVRWSRAPASSGKTGPPAPLGELVGGGGAIIKVALLGFGRNLAWGGDLGPYLGSPGQRAHRNGALRPGRFRKRGFSEPHSIILIYILLLFDFPRT